MYANGQKIIGRMTYSDPSSHPIIHTAELILLEDGSVKWIKHTREHAMKGSKKVTKSPYKVGPEPELSDLEKRMVRG